MGVKITEVAAKGSADGTELVPVSDSSNPKSVLVSDIKTYVVDEIEGITATTTAPLTDKVFILQGAALKPVLLSTVAENVINQIWSESLDAAPADTDIIAINDGSTTDNTVTLAVLAEYIKDTIEAALINLADVADGSGAIATTDYMLVTQGTTGKRIQISDLSTIIYASFATYLGTLALATAGADTDIVHIIQGGVEKTITLTLLKDYMGGANPVNGPATTTVDALLQWADTVGTAKDGPTVGTSIGAAGSDLEVATTKAVRDAIVAAESPDSYDTIWVPARTMTPSTTAGATPETHEYESLLFDGAAANESAEFNLVLPESWNLGTIKAKVYWAPGAAAANATEWVRFEIAAGALSDDDALDAAVGTAVNLDDQVIADDDLHISAASTAMTIGGSSSIGDIIHFKITRDFDYAGAGVAMDVDCRLFGVLIQIRKTVVPTAW